MVIGSLGGIVFTVSSEKIMTINNIKVSGSANFGKHQRHGGNTLLEYVGNDADTLSFDIKLAAQLGVDVEQEIDKIADAQRSGEALKLVIGKKVYGRYRWVIEKWSASYSAFDKNGKPILANVSLTLNEYLK